MEDVIKKKNFFVGLEPLATCQSILLDHVPNISMETKAILLFDMWEAEHWSSW